MTDWLSLTLGDAPLIVSVPHAGTMIPADVTGLRSDDLARWDADHHVTELYGFATELGATVIHSHISRTVIDLNRDPSGQSLYPGQVTTGLCPETTFDGEPLYEVGKKPNAREVTRRRAAYFDPYHAMLNEQIERLRAVYPAVVLYDAHSIRSHVPRLFEGELPHFNIGSFNGVSCSPALTDAIAARCERQSFVVNGRFKGGWITRSYGDPTHGIHAVQMELAIRGYADEDGLWPPPWDATRAAPMQAKLRTILTACLNFAREQQ